MRDFVVFLVVLTPSWTTTPQNKVRNEPWPQNQGTYQTMTPKSRHVPNLDPQTKVHTEPWPPNRDTNPTATCVPLHSYKSIIFRTSQWHLFPINLKCIKGSSTLKKKIIIKSQKQMPGIPHHMEDSLRCHISNSAQQRFATTAVEANVGSL